MSTTAGPYTQGEKPADLEYQFLDANGTAVDLSGYTGAKFQFQEHDSAAATVSNATITSASNGKVAYTFTGSEFATAGRYRAQFWVGNGVHRLASVDIYFSVVTSVGSVPAI